MLKILYRAFFLFASFCVVNFFGFAIAQEGGEKMLIVTSSAFKQGEFIPPLYTGVDKEISPPLGWEGIPEGTKSIAIICDDPDAPGGTWVHWVIFNLSPDLEGIPEKTPTEKDVFSFAKQGINDFGRLGYGGPMPPPGLAHRYFFKVYALDKMLDIPSGIPKVILEQAMKGHVLAEGELVGKFKR